VTAATEEVVEDTADGELEVPTDGEPSRLRKRRGPVTSFTPPPDDPDDVATVDDRIRQFRERFPQGVIKTRVEATWHHPDTLTPPTFQVEARILAEPGGYVMSVGHAARTQGEGEPPYADRALETAESVAIGRALRFLGFHGRGETCPPAS